MKIDMHTHASNYHQLREGSARSEIDKLLRDMEVSGVDRSVVLPAPTPPSIRDADAHNRAFLELLAGHDQLIPFCTVDLHDPDEANAQVDRAVAAGARGVKFMHMLQRVPIDSEASIAAYAAAESAGIPVLLHTGQHLEHHGKKVAGEDHGATALKFGDPLPVDDVAARYPGLRIVIAHFAWPWPEVAIAIMQRHRNVWLDLSGWAPKHFPSTIWAQMTKVHPDRFLFGTDFPFISAQRWITEFTDRVDDPRVRELVLGRNAEEVLTTA